MYFRKKITPLFLLIASLVVFSSCNDDDHYSLDQFSLSRATVDSISPTTYSFVLDNGKTLWVAASYVSYKPKDKQRAFINYTILSDSQSGFDHYIRLNNVANILTKNIIDLTAENESAIGNDPVRIFKMNTNGGFLNVDFGFNMAGTVPHFINLVRNTMIDNPNDGKVYLEFRHNAFNEPSLAGTNGYVAFHLDELQMPGGDSVNLVVKVKEFDGVKNYDLVYRFNDLSAQTENLKQIIPPSQEYQ